MQNTIKSERLVHSDKPPAAEGFEGAAFPKKNKCSAKRAPSFESLRLTNRNP